MMEQKTFFLYVYKNLLKKKKKFFVYKPTVKRWLIEDIFNRYKKLYFIMTKSKKKKH